MDIVSECKGDGGDEFELKWYPKEHLRSASKITEGHFRRVNYKVWEAYCDMYPGCGPAIYVELPEEVPEKEPDDGGEEDGKGQEGLGGVEGAPGLEEKDPSAGEEGGREEGEEEKEDGSEEQAAAAVPGDAEGEEGGEGSSSSSSKTEAKSPWDSFDKWVIDSKDEDRFVKRIIMQKTLAAKDPAQAGVENKKEKLTEDKKREYIQQALLVR